MFSYLLLASMRGMLAWETTPYEILSNNGVKINGTRNTVIECRRLFNIACLSLYMLVDV